MEDIKKLRHLYRLKEVSRTATIESRKESTAEHTYSSLILAEYFFPRIEPELDQLKAIRLILFHDIVEIEAGDTFFLDETGIQEQQKKEAEAFERLKQLIPRCISERYNSLWKEFEEGETREAKFALAIDKLDPIIQGLSTKEDWKHGITEQWLRDKKEHYMAPFPPIHRLFNELIEYAKREGFLQ
jgi:putative hydrolase of HD superfamily